MYQDELVEELGMTQPLIRNMLSSVGQKVDRTGPGQPSGPGRSNLAEIVIASNANMGGPTSAAAMAVARHFPEGTRITAPKGGLTLWLELDPAVDGMQVFHEARKRRIAILPGIMCSTTKKYKNFIRISCGFRWGEEIDRGIATLGQIAKDLSA